jgi:hypothetical protein
MIILSHISYPALLFIIIAQLFSIHYSLFDILILIFFSTLPDLDFVFSKLFMGRKYDNNFQHHKWFTHWPIIYSPLLILLFIFPSLELFLVCFGIFSHFGMDTFLAGDGIMWFYPFSKKFFNFFAKNIKDHHGWKWFQIYKKMIVYKIDIIAFIFLLLLLSVTYFL